MTEKSVIGARLRELTAADAALDETDWAVSASVFTCVVVVVALVIAGLVLSSTQLADMALGVIVSAIASRAVFEIRAIRLTRRRAAVVEALLASASPDQGVAQ